MGATILDDVIEVLSDGEWHSVGNIYSRVLATPRKVALSIRFLIEQKLVDTRKYRIIGTKHIRLTEPVRKLYLETKEGGE